MKTTPLPEILKKITPLPYAADSDQITAKEGRLCVADLSECDGQFEQREANAAYLTHAANVLPGLVEALQACLRDCDSKEVIHHRSRITLSLATQQQARHALSLAINVPVNS